MSVFSAIKRAFGFGPDAEYDNETADDVDDAPLALAEAPAEEKQEEAVEGLSDVPTLPEIDPAVKQKIFAGAVAIFNESLPDFLRESVDADKQQKRLAEAIDKGVDDYLNGLMLVAEQYAEAKLKGATENARRESERLRSDMQQIEQQRTSLREQQLSADRRRRALADRVTDLESQLAAAEAEREQYELERRSLMNKLKVADIQPGVVEDLQKEIEQLRAQLASGAPAEAQSAVQGVDPAEHEAVLAREKEALAKAAELEARVAELAETNKTIAEEKAAVDGLLADLRTQQELSQGMYNDLQTQYATERDAHREAEESLAEARKIVASVAEIQEQMSQVESMIRKRDERISRLKANNKKLREQLDAALNAARGAANEGLFAFSDEKPQAASPKISADNLAAIEDDFEVPEWFVSEPLPGEVSPLLASDAEFGYQEPPRKPRKPENDAQLSLF